MGEYNQAGERGDICALVDGKALLGMAKREDGTSEYALSVYDVKAGKTLGGDRVNVTKHPVKLNLVLPVFHVSRQIQDASWKCAVPIGALKPVPIIGEMSLSEKMPPASPLAMAHVYWRTSTI